MKKQKIQILILLVLCIVCVGGYFIIRNHTFETEEKTVSVDVTNFNKDDVTELILSGDHEVHLVKTDDAWTESSLPDETIKESTVNTLLKINRNMRCIEIVRCGLQPTSGNRINRNMRCIEIYRMQAAAGSLWRLIET